MKFDAILYDYWEADALNDSTVIGHWSEDHSTYYIVVPPQLRSQIIELHNWLVEKKQTIEKMEYELREAKKFFEM